MKATNNLQVSEVKLTYKNKIKPSQRPVIKEAKDVFALMKRHPEMKENIEYKELFYAIYLNRANQVLSVHKISEGGTSFTAVDVKFILQAAILQNAEAIIICHNHPSGQLKPSDSDISLTMRIKNACFYFGIQLLDSLIISKENYYSFAIEDII